MRVKFLFILGSRFNKGLTFGQWVAFRQVFGKPGDLYWGCLPFDPTRPVNPLSLEGQCISTNDWELADPDHDKTDVKFNRCSGVQTGRCIVDMQDFLVTPFKLELATILNQYWAEHYGTVRRYADSSSRMTSSELSEFIKLRQNTEIDQQHTHTTCIYTYSFPKCIFEPGPGT